MIFCTFVGYVAGGPWGALAIFASAMVIVFLWKHRLAAAVILGLAAVAGWLAFG